MIPNDPCPHGPSGKNKLGKASGAGSTQNNGPVDPNRDQEHGDGYSCTPDDVGADNSGESQAWVVRHEMLGNDTARGSCDH